MLVIVNEETSLRPLVEAFLWPLLFFETCGEDVLDPDVAVRQMEDIAFALGELDEPMRRKVGAILEQIAAEQERPKIKSLILDLPQRVGWVDG